jgi:hypothetical protein
MFLFSPLLARLRFDRIVDAAGYPGSKMVPACNALLSLLLLKLLDKERRSHIDDFNCDEDLGLWAGLAVKGLGREQPTLFLSNNAQTSPRDLVANYARRNGVEDALGSSVNFFHLDCLASDVRLNVDLDTVLTVLAQGCYRWLASELHGFGQAKPKRVYRKFVETPGTIEIESRRQIVVYLDRRAHNPVLREAQLDKDCPPIPWLGNRRLQFICM